MIKLSQAYAFIIFYAIFLGAMLSSMSRHSAFDTANIFGRNKSTKALLRFVIGIIFLNGLPVLNFFWLFDYMDQKSPVTSISVGLAIVVCFTIFACNRLYTTVAGVFGSLHPDDVDKKNPSYHHFFGALIYIIIPLTLFFVFN